MLMTHLGLHASLLLPGLPFLWLPFLNQVNVRARCEGKS